MKASIQQIVIVGAGLAGAKAAESLRSSGFEGEITLLGDEPERPYTRPPLSKGYLRGERERDSFRVHPEDFYAANRIDLRTSTYVQAVRPASREVALADGSRLGFDRLLLATGARPRTLEIPGGDLRGVLTLRTLADADALRAALGDAERIAVVGAGWIGSEVAASLRALERQVTLLAPRRAPLESVIGPEVGAVFGELHRERGVDLRTRSRVSRILGVDRATGVELESGERLPADLVVVGIGVDPRIELAAEAGLAIGDGIEVSATLETSAPGVFAAGDVANAWHPFFERRIRVEHLSNARLQGQAVGPLLLGATTPFDQVPSFFSEQYGVKVEYTGHAPASSPLVIRGGLAERSFVAFRLVDGRVGAGIGVNSPGVGKALEALIRSGRVVEPTALADESVSLESLAGLEELSPA